LLLSRRLRGRLPSAMPYGRSWTTRAQMYDRRERSGCGASWTTGIRSLLPHLAAFARWWLLRFYERSGLQSLVRVRMLNILPKTMRLWKHAPPMPDRFFNPNQQVFPPAGTAMKRVAI